MAIHASARQRGVTLGLFEDMQNRGVHSAYLQYVVGLESILHDMSVRGMPVSPERHAEVKEQLGIQQGEIWAAMQSLVPASVRACSPKAGYKKPPKDFIDGAATTHAGEPAVWSMRDFVTKLSPISSEVIIERRCVKLVEWSPSHEGLKRYMRHKGHAIPPNWKTGKVSTNQIELNRLATRTKDLLYDTVLEYRDCATLLENHVKNWAPGKDGRVHPTFYYDTGTGQLGARRPNTMNAPRHKANQGQLFRSMVRAREGHTLLECDYKSFHVQTLAFAAGDADLLRLAKMDVHSYLTAHFLKLPDAGKCLAWSDGELRDYLSTIKHDHGPIRDAKVKHAMLGYNNGMGYRKLYNQYMEFFDSQSEAKRLMDLLDSLFPKSRQFREDICKQAHEQGYLISRYGCIRWFWEVFKWSNGAWEHGEEQEAAKSFIGQNTAHCYLKDAMIRLNGDVNSLYDLGWNHSANLINPIHDALMFECPDELLEQACVEIPAEMSRPSIVLTDPIIAPNGLSIEVDVKIGKSWDQMRGLPIPCGVA